MHPDTRKFGRRDYSTHEHRQPADKIKISCFSKQGISEKAAELYASGLSLRDISRELRLAKSTILKSLKQAGVSLRASTHEHKTSRTRDKNPAVGVPPFGFGRLRGKLVVDAKEIETVRLVMNLWQQGKTFRTIAKHLNSLNLRTRKGGKKRRRGDIAESGSRKYRR